MIAVTRAIDTMRRVADLMRDRADADVINELCAAADALESYLTAARWMDRNFVRVQRDCNRGVQ